MGGEASSAIAGAGEARAVITAFVVDEASVVTSVSEKYINIFCERHPLRSK